VISVVASGWVVGPCQLQSGETSYYFLGGTSMASPHVAGIGALMTQKNGSLVTNEVETIFARTDQIVLERRDDRVNRTKREQPYRLAPHPSLPHGHSEGGLMVH
jgi:subtilisin family serine protease